MSAVMSDPTAGYKLVSTRSNDLLKTRYLFLALNLIDPDRQFELEHLRYSNGGEEIQTHCMRRSVGGLLERGKLTPLEVWTEAIPPVLLGEGLEYEAVRIEGVNEAEGMNPNRPGALAGVGASLSHFRFFPGDEIKTILKTNEGKGVVEVKALLDVPWYRDEEETVPGIPQILNRDFFPSVPRTLNGLREMIDKAEGRSDLHRNVARDMVTSCEQGRRWAEARLAAEHVLLRQRVSPNGQHVYTYSPLARILLEQLEMKPQDAILEQGAGVSPEIMNAILEKVGNTNSLSVETVAQIAGAVAQQFLQAQQVAQPAETVQAEQTPAQKRAETLARKKAEADATPADNGSQPG